MILQRLLERVTHRLQRRNAGILQMDIELSVPGTEPTRFTVGLVRPSLDQKQLRELLRLQLERVQLRGGLAAATLRVTRTAPVDIDQTALLAKLNTFPRLRRLIKGWLKAEWKESETGREAKFYALTASGRKQLAVEKHSWARLSGAVQMIFGEGDG